MTKMSETQRHTLLSFNDAQANRGIVTALRHSTIKALVRNGWAFYPKGWPSGMRRVARSAYVTSQGLRAAGYDMDAIHAAALTECKHGVHATLVCRPCDAEAQQVAEVIHAQEVRDADHAEALDEDAQREQCGCTRNPLGHSRAEHPEGRDAHSSAYWESATEGMPRVPAF